MIFNKEVGNSPKTISKQRIFILKQAFLAFKFVVLNSQFIPKFNLGTNKGEYDEKVYANG
ncbi:MAG: hypothetical protein XD93_0265 [candidate division WS6 bacterium 34_10]|uniref:Uncharacterized protein n=1 Tax=candidate division WS6 bacterium 34_10 TaxID=1641389 RepID=A0A117M0E9_9BACT|nr:MAG: hypothetical protein XD93_0265 [candidate division WS6 bacterium 34_10]